eukprot:CAMPEP_0176245500 /NCGR_PEP_ID=MMETSP0121_2-20121125/31974_1 /TAXON_ID=160619 /ORGANISM="Kryptoperidinium foliaceum, Strain CCMP 1326" /LENGTH=34 /DNA_ID= /DNA_START= /DNA_END= /DNA_ORIENTATION=
MSSGNASMLHASCLTPLAIASGIGAACAGRARWE